MMQTVDPLNAAKNLRDTIISARAETEENRCLAPQVVRGLIEHGLCRLSTPADVGGLEAEPLLILKVYEELAKAEASVAWIVWNNALPSLHSRWLKPSARSEIFSDSNQILANSTRPSGKAVEVDGGYRVSGRWSLVSGCELADWIPLTCIVTNGKEPKMLPSGDPETRFTYLQKGSYEIIDTWHVGGLRGTGSHDVSAENVFVKSDLTYMRTDPIQIDRPLYRMPGGATMSSGCAAMCIGIAQASIDAILELSASKVQVDTGLNMRDRPATQATVAESSASLDAARLLVHTALEDAWEACCKGIPVSEKQRARMRGGALFAANTAKAVTTAMYEVAGASSNYIDSPIERAHRDVHAIAQHIVLNSKWAEEAGRVLFGMSSSV